MQEPMYKFGDYSTGTKIGQGSFGDVYELVLNPGAHNVFGVPLEALCVKVITDKSMPGARQHVDLKSEAMRRMLAREFDGPRALKHRNIMRVFHVFTEVNAAGWPQRVYVILERAGWSTDGPEVQHYLRGAPSDPAALHAFLTDTFGGPAELYRYLVTRPRMTEAQTRFIMYQILAALRAMHSAEPAPIMHRDLKCENVLVAGEVRTPSAGLVPLVKIADFGHARTVPPRVLEHFVGTAARDGGPKSLVTKAPVHSGFYVARELRTDSYDTKVDIFSAGVILYVLYTKMYPFDDDPAAPAETPRLTATQRHAQGKWVQSRLQHGAAFAMSDEGRALLAGMLAFNPSERLTATACLAHPWFDPIRAEVATVFADTTLLHLASGGAGGGASGGASGGAGASSGAAAAP